MFASIAVIGGTLALIILVAFLNYRHSKGTKKVLRQFLDEEQEANTVRRKEIEPELFFEADLNGLPGLPEGDPHRVMRCARRKMIRFNMPMSNLELKKKYGPSQIETIVQYEENYNEYLRALVSWGTALVKENKTDDAVVVLKAVISLGVEIRGPYKLLADVYAVRRDARGFDELKEWVNTNHFRDQTVKNHIIEYVNQQAG